LSDLAQKISDKSAVIGILGLGYVGLPLAVAFAEAGFRVIGFDILQNRADSVNRSVSYIADVPSEHLASVRTRIEATTDPKRLQDMDTISICVPTPLTKAREPDLSYVVSTAETIRQNLRPAQLVVMESTTYPGTTREVIQPILERSGMKAGSDFYLAYSPERIDPGNREFTLRNTPKLVAGINAESARLAERLYRQVVDRVITLSAPEVAELTKVFENVFRSVNIALVNELNLLCHQMGISIWEVIDAAATKPFGYMPFRPGPGIGGHCIPLDPYYLASKAREYDFHTRFIELAAEINERMPYQVTSWIMEALNSRDTSLNGASVLVLGASYKKDIGDIRESPAIKLMQQLREKGARVSYHDPYVPEINIGGEIMKSVTLGEGCLNGADCVVIATDHSQYDYQFIADKSKLVFDARGVTRGLKADNIIRL
jgi:UDP-N-acetyl-D-glucosamine dehydrogenase